MKKTKKSASKGASLVQYGDYTEEDAQEDREELDASQRGIMYKLPPGKTRARVIPPLPGKKWKKVVYEHMVKVPGVGNVSIVCPRLMEKKFCSLCKREQELFSSGNNVDQKKAKEMKAKRRCYANFIIRGKEELGPKVIAFGAMIENQLVDMRTEEEHNFVDPVKGVDIVISKKGTGFSTEYKVFAADKGQPCPLHADTSTMNDWITTQHNLDRFAKVLTQREIEAKLAGESPDDEEDEDEEETSSRRGRRSVADEMDDDEDDEEKSDDEDEEDED